MKEEKRSKGCCDKCWNSKFALKGKNKATMGCGLSCPCHLLIKQKAVGNEYLPTPAVISTQKEKVVAVMVQKSTAIDFTPIYYIRTCKPIKSGSLLKWDTESKNIILD